MATSKQVKSKDLTKVNNPTGKGGFGDRPQDRSSGHWDSTNTISFQYRRFLKMSPEELEAYANSPDSEKTVAMQIAFAQVRASIRSLAHAKEVTDRTEGKAPQAIDITSGGERLKTALVEFVGAPAPKKPARKKAVTKKRRSARAKPGKRKHTDTR